MGLLVVFPAQAGDLTLLYTHQSDGPDALRTLTFDPATLGPTVKLVPVALKTEEGTKAAHGVPSPDGAHVICNAQPAEGRWQIRLTRSDGSDPRQASNPGEANDSNPDWAPDGRRVVYASTVSGNGDLYVRDLATGAPAVRLTEEPARENFPAWSPDGNRIAFVSDREGTPGIYLMHAGGGEPWRISAEGLTANEPAWTPDSRFVVYQALFEGSWKLMMVPADQSAQPAWLTWHDTANDRQPAVSPDGRWLVFESDRDGGHQLFLAPMPADLGTIVEPVARLTTEGLNYSPRWFPTSAAGASAAPRP